MCDRKLSRHGKVPHCQENRTQHLMATNCNHLLEFAGLIEHLVLPAKSHLVVKLHVPFSIKSQGEIPLDLYLGQMCNKGVLEVILVDAEGIRHTNHVGTPAYYVTVQCGTHEHKSKVSLAKDGRAGWNEKFIFEFPLTDWKRLTHIKFRIMDTRIFKAGGFVGETIIFLGGTVAEGIHRGVLELKPTSYNVVLEDDTYKGEIKIGFRFIITDAEQSENEPRSYMEQANASRQPLFTSIVNLCRFSWWRSWFIAAATEKDQENQV